MMYTGFPCISKNGILCFLYRIDGFYNCNVMVEVLRAGIKSGKKESVLSVLSFCFAPDHINPEMLMKECDKHSSNRETGENTRGLQRGMKSLF